MFQNYFLTAVRNLLKNKLFSILNIGGLAIGLAACILIFLFVRDEVSYESWLPERENIFLLEATFKSANGSVRQVAVSPGRFKEPLEKEYAQEIEAITRIYFGGHLVKFEENTFIQTIGFVDPSFFNVFDFPIITGNREDAFRDNQSVVISETAAKKYFGDQDPIGQLLSVDNESFSMKVVAVMKDLPHNTHLEFEMIALLDPERYIQRPWVLINWFSSNSYTYLKLKDAERAGVIEASFPGFIDRVVERDSVPNLAMEPSERVKFNLMPVTDVHLFSEATFHMNGVGDIKVVYSFAVVATLILIIASINFVNLSTARASKRAREIALRKVVGAKRGQLIAQFLGEAGLTVLISLMIAVVLVELLLPWFGNFVTKLLSMNYAGDPTVQFGLLGLLIVVGIGAGLHPAFQITKFRPAEVLKSNQSSTDGKGLLQKILVTLQFAISIGLITTTIIVYGQTKFAKEMDIGFQKDNRLMIRYLTFPLVAAQKDVLKNEYSKLPGVKNIAFTERTTPITGYYGGEIKIQGRGEENYKLESVNIDENFLDFLGAEIIAGRGFSEEFQADFPTPMEGEDGTRQSIVINEDAVKHLGYESPEAAVGQSFRFSANGVETGFFEYNIIGVAKNMNLRSLRLATEPMVFKLNRDLLGTMNLELDPTREAETLLAIDEIWKSLIPDFPIERSFMGDEFERFYQEDEQRGEMFLYFSLFAILVSCLGLFGLASFTAEQKTKEIGVRKVHGAGIRDIVTLLAWQFSKPVIAANLVAWPIAWYFMADWLEGFAYRISMTPLPFIIAGSLALFIAWGTVAFHAWRVASTNPVNALRYE